MADRRTQELIEQLQAQVSALQKQVADWSRILTNLAVRVQRIEDQLGGNQTSI